jgi:hypothetical protein
MKLNYILFLLCLSPIFGLAQDSDSDGIDDVDEATYGTDINLPDSDFDGLLDGEEVFGAYGYVTDPTNPDSDFDGLNDGNEAFGNFGYVTDPTNPDSDADGLSDGDEAFGNFGYATDPTNPDSDFDNLMDGDEIFVYGTDPTNPDSDFDGLLDGEEVFNYLTDPNNPDSDFDGLSDFEEVITYMTNPNNQDTDNGGISDGDEVLIAFDPLDNTDDASAPIVKVTPRAFLQGATLNPNAGEETLMRDDLRVAGIIPTVTPFIDGLTTQSTVFNTTGTNAIVDWVFVELRDSVDNTVIIDSQSALLQRDGDIVGVDGVSPLIFLQMPGNYYFVIKHRNHLGIMTANTVALTYAVVSIDFTDANNQITYGTDAQTTFGMPSDLVGMWSGDVNNDGRLNYIGANSESPFISGQVFNDPDNSLFGGPPVGSYKSEGYFDTDVDMNGETIYIGANSDIPFISSNIFNNPSNSLFGGPPISTYEFLEQLP